MAWDVPSFSCEVMPFYIVCQKKIKEMIGNESKIIYNGLVR